MTIELDTENKQRIITHPTGVVAVESLADIQTEKDSVQSQLDRLNGELIELEFIIAQLSLS